MSTHASSDEYITYSAISILSDDRRCFSFFLSFLFSPRRAMKQDFFSGTLCTIGLNLRFNNNIFFQEAKWTNSNCGVHMTKWLSTKLDRADQESNWFSVIMYRPTYALPFFMTSRLTFPCLPSHPIANCISLYDNWYLVISKNESNWLAIFR